MIKIKADTDGAEITLSTPHRITVTWFEIRELEKAIKFILDIEKQTSFNNIEITLP